MANFTPIRIFGILSGLGIMISGIIWSLIPASYIFSEKVDKSEFMEVKGVVTQIELFRQVFSRSRESFSVSLIIKEFPQYVFYMNEIGCYTEDDIKLVSKSFVAGDSITMVIYKGSYYNKLKKPYPSKPSGFSLRMKRDREIYENHKFVQVYGCRKGNKEFLSFNDYLKYQNSPAGFFSYLFFGMGVISVVSGLLVTYLCLRKALKG